MFTLTSAVSGTAAEHECLPPGDEPLISGLLWRNIIGQGVFQLGLMYALVTHGDAIFSVPAHASVDGPSVNYTIVFNIFVLLQLFNQVQLGSAYGQAVCYRSRRLQIGSIL